MAKLTKKQKLVAEKFDSEKFYALPDALEILSSVSSSKFKEALDVSVNLGVDPRKSDQVVRGATTLPHGTGKDVRVAVFAQGENAAKAQQAGADVVGFEDLGEEIKGGKIDFDVLIATPDAMRIVGQLGKVLGPRGLMPNPKTGTVTTDVEVAVKNSKSGQVQFRTDKAGLIHGRVGQLGFSVEQIKENIQALLVDLKKAKPAAAKGVYLKKLTLSSTMGPGLNIDQASLEVQ
tara:strand:+ start:298 stop:996 length:699 start_codon:yes stop_codon:yes gene_type:complete